MWEYKNQPREIVIFAYIKLSKVINFITHLVADNHAIIKAVHKVPKDVTIIIYFDVMILLIFSNV